MKRRTLLTILIACVLLTMGATAGSAAGVQKVTLKSDSGKYLARCNDCIPGGAYPDSAFVHVPEAELMTSPWAQFTLEKLSNKNYALRADSGRYLARCNDCISGGAYPDSAFVHVPEAELMTSPWAQFSLVKLGDGKSALKFDNGEYLARCNDCIPGGAYPDSAFMHVPESKLKDSPWAHWEISKIK